jgi:predicted HAD superfamily Cof-like phosphohydrolase
MREAAASVRALMAASGQDVSQETAILYAKLIVEEGEEFRNAQSAVEQLDGICDLIWVLIGFSHAMGYDIAGAFAEVTRSNLSKIPLDGKMLLREDGKFLKPSTYSPPDLEKFVCPSNKS